MTNEEGQRESDKQREGEKIMIMKISCLVQPIDQTMYKPGLKKGGDMKKKFKLLSSLTLN